MRHRSNVSVLRPSAEPPAQALTQHLDTAASRNFVGLRFAALTMEVAVRTIVQRDPAAAFDYVVTPNVDHVVRLHEHRDGVDLDAYYHDPFLCLCDSRVLAMLALLTGTRLSAVPGSDLVVQLLPATLCPGDRLTLIGGDDLTLQGFRAACPEAVIVQHQPPMGLLSDEAAIARCVAFVEDHPARYVLLAVGSPQQELLAWRIRLGGKATGLGLCIGASVEFLTGKLARAPLWMRQLLLEWLYRLLQNPGRLWRRYLLRGPRIVSIVLRERRER
jgi:N-acetylglucosaminyldiphosphoundecaprenol N-acetyl-beta-D-mannosaminyltransferase